MTTRSSRGTLAIDVEKCKGCELCIPACPPNVLVMSSAVNETGYRYPELTPGWRSLGNEPAVLHAFGDAAHDLHDVRLRLRLADVQRLGDGVHVKL